MEAFKTILTFTEFHKDQPRADNVKCDLLRTKTK